MLAELADTLSMPRRFVWDLLGAEGRSGKDLISDWTGLDREGWAAGGLGAGLEMIGDPLTYALPAGAGALTKAFRAFSPAVKAAETMSAAKNLGLNADEIYRYVPKTGSYSMGTIAAPSGQSTLGQIGAAVAENPYAQKVSRFLADESSPGLNLNPGYRSLRDLTDDITIIKKAGPVGDPNEVKAMISTAKSKQPYLPEGADIGFGGRTAGGDVYGYTGKVVHRGMGGDATGHLLDTAVQDIGKAGMAAGQELPWQGQYLSAGGQFGPRATISRTANDLGQTLRHEVGGHGVTEAAALADRINELPLLQRIPASLMQDAVLGREAPGLKYTLGHALDEAYSHMVERRGLLPQLQRYADFLGLSPKVHFGFDPKMAARRGAYADYFAQTSPLAAALFEGAGAAPYVLGAAGAGLGGAALLNEIFKRQLGQQPEQAFPEFTPRGGAF